MALRRPKSAVELRRRRAPVERQVRQKLPLPWRPSNVDLGPRYHETLAPKAEVPKAGGLEGWKERARARKIPTPQVATPKLQPPPCLLDPAVRPRQSGEPPGPSPSRLHDAATSREAVPLPGLAELQQSQVVFERWTCLPELPTQLQPSRATALRLREALQEGQVDLELQLVGAADAPARRLLLMWCLGCCCELLNLLEPAAALFAKCTAWDLGDPVHAYNRGVILLRLHQWQAASRDFDLAASRCLEKGGLLPPMLLARRALANLHLQRLPEVWADFELARLRTAYPSFSLRQLQRQLAKEEIHCYAAYCRSLTLCASHIPAQRHWLAQSLAGRKLQEATEVVRQSVLELLRTLPGFADLQSESLPWDAMSVVLLRGGQPLLPSYGNVSILFSGQLRVLRFAAAPTKPMEAPPYVEEELLLSSVSSFCGVQGRQQDGWLVATAQGACLLQITMQGMRRM